MAARLESHQRETIYKYLKQGESYRQIAKYLNRSPETIRLEVKKNGGIYGYNDKNAQKRSTEKRKMQGNKPTHLLHYDLIEYIDNNYDNCDKSIKLLGSKGRLNHCNAPSLKTIYNWLFKGYLDTKYDEILRPRKRREKVIKSGKRMLGKPISLREEEQNMDEYGHGEIDLVVGANNNTGYIITLLERKTRFSFTTKINLKNPEFVNEKLYDLIDQFHPKMFKSITADNGLEFNNLGELTDKFNIDVYYAFPYSPGQRGRNENGNGLLRRFFPKGTDFTKVSLDELDHVTYRINTMPREILGGKSPNELFQEHLGQILYD